MESQKPLQFIVGHNNRTAGEGFHEHQHIYYPDPKHWLEWAPMEKQDQHAIENERFFKRRFDFAPPEEQRRHVIAIKKRFDFTDLEITNLKKSGLLTASKGKPTSLRADPWAYWLGVFQIVVFSGFMMLYALIFNFSNLPTWPKLAGVVLFTALALGVAALYHRTSIKPIRTLKQRGFKLGDRFVLQDAVESNSDEEQEKP